MNLTTIALVAITLLGTLPTGGQTRVQRPAQSVTLKSIRNEKLAAAFYSGRLPEPILTPEGRPDEVAAALAKQVAAGNDQSTPALLTAIMAMGFGIRDSDGVLTQTVQPGQGLVFEAWEVAAMAKMYGERRTVGLSDFCEALKTIPELKQAPLEKIVLDGIRKQAVTEQPELRFWARFIVELGRNSEQPYDLLGAGVDKNAPLDTIQNALILRRLVGDIHALGQRPKQARTWKQSVQPAVAGGSITRNRDQHQYRRSHHRTHPLPQVVLTASKTDALILGQPQQQPCRMSDMEATIADIRATALTTAFGQLIEYAEQAVGGTAGDLFGAYAKFANLANILLAYAKFIATYAALETEITVENPPLVRNTDTRAGQNRQLTAKVSMNIGKFQQVNCFRWLLNAGTGLDFNLMNDGPLEGVAVIWHIDKGGTADFYHSGDKNLQLVQFAGNGPRIQDAGTYAGIPGKPGVPVGNLTETKTDAQGNARITLQGVARRNYIPAPQLPVMKSATVSTTVRIKGGDIKGDAVDIAGHVLGGMLTLPAELLYRTDWASTASVEVPVKDFESCDKGWYGTINYSEEWEGKPQGLQKVSRKSHHETIEVKGDSSIAQGDVTTTDIYEGRANVTNSCLMFRRHFGSGSARREADVRVLLDGTGGYKLFINAPIMEVITKYEISACGHGGRQDQFSSETSRGFGVGVNSVEGKLDPAKPGEISGTAALYDTTKVTWNLRRCQ